MDAGIAELAPDVGAEQPHLVGSPAQHAGEESQSPVLEAGLDMCARPLAEVLEIRIPRPGTNGPLEAMLRHVGESSVRHVLAHRLEDLQFALKAFVALGSDAVPRGDAPIRRETVVVARELRRVLGLLDPAAGFQSAHALCVQRGPVLDGAVETADVNKVEEAFLKRPLRFHVVDLEPRIRGYPGRLDWR